MGFWLDISNSLKENKEGFSDRKVTLLMFMILSTIDLFSIILISILRITRTVQINDSTLSIIFETLTYVFALLLITEAVWCGLITIPHVVELFQAYKGVKASIPDTIVTTETKIRQEEIN